MCGLMSPGDLCQWYHVHPLLQRMHHGVCWAPPLCKPHQWLPGVQLCPTGSAGPTGMVVTNHIRMEQLYLFHIHSPLSTPQSPQVSCYSSSCPQGTYPSSPSSSNGLPSGSTLQLVLQGITTLCLPCDGLCASCTGPGNISCTTCRYARRYAECVSGCDNATGIDMVHYLLCTYK